MRKINEECGVFGIVSPAPVSAAAYTATALQALQHRGQEGAGLATFYSDGSPICRKNTGLVSDIFGEFLTHVPATEIAVGHVRYSTTGGNTVENTQPILTVHSRLTCALAHNGNITNAAHLRNRMVNDGGKVFHTSNDSEIFNMLIIDKMLACRNLEKAVLQAVRCVEGAYSLVIATAEKLIAVRDPSGFRPLCMGKLGDATVFSSESCAFDAMGATFVRDIRPGELVSVDKQGRVTCLMSDQLANRGLCVFEMIYFARPDSFIDGMSVYRARREMGKALYRQRPTAADIVCGVPDSGLDAALGYAEESGIHYAPAFVKNKYVGRSFILPTQKGREHAVNVKLNPLRAEVEGERVVLVDDSIVRGTTSARIIQSLRHAGAREVHMRISSPPFKFPCHFGTDIDSTENLIANNFSEEQICKKIGADTLEYLHMDNLMRITQGTDVRYCAGCFAGTYPISVLDSGKNKFD